MLGVTSNLSVDPIKSPAKLPFGDIVSGNGILGVWGLEPNSEDMSKGCESQFEELLTTSGNNKNNCKALNHIE